MANPYRKPAAQQKMAQERIAELFLQAKIQFAENPSLSNRYVVLARRIGMKYKVRIPSSLRKSFCRNCNAYLTSKNSRIRLRNSMVVLSCQECKHIRRFRYKP